MYAIRRPAIEYAQDSLRIHVHASIGRLLIAPALPRFIRQYPGRRVQVSEFDVIGPKAPHDADVIVCVGPIADSRLIAQPIARIHAVTCAAPDFIERNGLPATPADLAPTDCIGSLEPGTNGARDWIFGRGRATFSVRPAAPLVFSDSESAMAAAVRGGGYVRVLSFEADQRIASGLLQPVLEDWNERTWSVSIGYARDRVAGDEIAAFSAFLATLFPLPTGTGLTGAGVGLCGLFTK